MEHIVIIGNGISGITAARHIRKRSAHKITVISAETKYFYSRTALMYIYMGHMKFEHTKPYEDSFWKKNNIDIVHDYVCEIDYNTKRLYLKSSESLTYDKLILAVGSKPNKFGWPGQDLDGVQGLYSYQDLQLLEANSKNAQHAVIVGGGLIGIELAEMLRSRKIGVTMLVREQNFWGNVLPIQESELIGRHIRDHHIDLRVSTELEEIIGTNGRVSHIRTKKGETIDCQIVGLATGVSPNIDFLQNTKLELNRGVLIDRYFKTNIPDIYAIGDCAEFRDPIENRKAIEQVWYTGKIMGEQLALNICGHSNPYTPGHWFNSAKFLDIEFQTYGNVPAKLDKSMSSFYWEDKNRNLCMRFVYEKYTHQFLGINTLGIRLRHDAFDSWLTQEVTIGHVLEHLKDANFDPELYRKYEEQIIEQFNRENDTSIKPKKKSWKRILAYIKS